MSKLAQRNYLKELLLPPNSIIVAHLDSPPLQEVQGVLYLNIGKDNYVQPKDIIKERCGRDATMLPLCLPIDKYKNGKVSSPPRNRHSSDGETRVGYIMVSREEGREWLSEAVERVTWVKQAKENMPVFEEYISDKEAARDARDDELLKALTHGLFSEIATYSYTAQGLKSVVESARYSAKSRLRRLALRAADKLA